MHVAIIGAGALGRVYGVHLVDGGERVTFVVRAARVAETSPFVIQRKNGDRRRRELVAPIRSAHVPADADLVLLTIRVDQLDDGIERLVKAAPPVPLVSLTPLLPNTLARVSGWVDGRALVGMPTLAASAREDGVDDYWAFRASPSLFEAGPPEVARLVAALGRSGIPARLSSDVRARNPATTMAFFPISVAVSRAGGIERLLEDPELCRLGARAARETYALARQIGPIDAAAALALRTVTPGTLRAAFTLLTRLLPRATRFVDDHFGDKLGQQHRCLGAEILELGSAHGVPLPSLAALLAQ